MKPNLRTVALILSALFLGVAGCGGGGDDAPAPAPPPPPPSGTVIGPAGGTVNGPSGTSVVIPAGALSANTTIIITTSSASAPALPAGHTAAGQMFALTPHGTTFAVPVTVTIPFDPALVAAGKRPALYKTTARGQWEQLSSSTLTGSSVSAAITSFSDIVVGDPPLYVLKPLYEYEIYELKGDGLEEDRVVRGKSIADGLFEHHDFAAAHRDGEVYSFDGTLVRPSDEIASVHIASTPDGSDWWLGSEAPIGIMGSTTELVTIGTRAKFTQTQLFVKRSSDARLNFYLVDAVLQTSDANGTLDRGCPTAHLISLYCDMITARVSFQAYAYTFPAGDFDEFEYFYRINGFAQLTGVAGSWDSEAMTLGNSPIKLWNIEDFAFTIDAIEGHEEALVNMSLAHPSFHEYSVDLSSIEVGQTFMLQFVAETKTYNRAASSINGVGAEFETSALSYLREPRTPQGVKLSHSGLESFEVPEPLLLPPVLPEEPEPCSDPDAQAGTIQFDAAEYTQLESNDSPSIRVTRIGGSEGAVTVRFSTSDGSAVAGIDYEAQTSTVFFGDGDDSPRAVSVQAINDSLNRELDKGVNLTLSQPGGCATLGAQDTAVLIIKDDDIPPPPPGYTVGGTVTGLVGSGLTLEDHHFTSLTVGNGPFTFGLTTVAGSEYEVTITAQPVNPVQVCSITNGSGVMGNSNVSNIVVNCAPPASPPGLDPTFGGGTGIVSSTFGGDDTDMLLQADGKIIMVGGSTIDFTMARYNPDGTLDAGFGDEGLVTTDIAGGPDGAYAAALLADGRIVVVGQARVGSNDDFALVRYESNGTVDESFGQQGKVTTDFAGGRDRAYAVAIQSDGSIVAAGDSLPITGTNGDFAVARYHANGAPDTSFGSAGTGRVSTDIAGGYDIAKNVVIENSGTILVTGVISMGSSSVLGHTGLARYTAAGVLDSSLNQDGIHTLPDLSLGEGLLLQGDGRMLVAGNVTVANEIVFGVMRLEADGAADVSFGSRGLASARFSALFDTARDVVLDASGRILLSGQASNYSNPNFAVARFTSAGVLDTSFDTDGMFTIDFFGLSDSAENIAVQTDGKIVLGGFAVNNASLRFGLARVNP